jgi:hypothetical protein
VGQTALKSVQALVDSQRSALLDEAIALALLEVQGMESHLRDEEVYKKLLEATVKAAIVVKERWRYVTTSTVPNLDGTSRTEFKFKTSPSFQKEQAALTQDLMPLVLHVCLLAESKARVADEKASRKNEVKKAAVAMDVDEDIDGPMKKMIDKAVERKVKKLGKLQVSSLPSSSQITTELFDFIVGESIACSRSRQSSEAEEIKEEDEPPRMQGQAGRKEGYEAFAQEKGRQQCWIEGSAERQREGQGLRLKAGPFSYIVSRRDIMSLCNFNNMFCCCALGDDKSKSYSVGLEYEVLCEKHFKYNRPSTYPDWFLEIPIELTAEHVVLRMPLDILEASRYRKHIHLSSGVSMPLYLQKSLSVGMKYLLAPHPFMHY